jgi:hypothetical protein
MPESTPTDARGRTRRRLLVGLLLLTAVAVLITPVQWAVAYYLFERDRRREGLRPPGRGGRPTTTTTTTDRREGSPHRRRTATLDAITDHAIVY